MNQAKSAIHASQFLTVLSRQAALPRNLGLADSLVCQLRSTSYREFAKHREHTDGHDLILSAAVQPNGRVAFTYRRDGTRIGLQIGSVNRIGDEILYSGRWFQQSKQDGFGGCGRRSRPKYSDFAASDDSASAWKKLRYL